MSAPGLHLARHHESVALCAKPSMHNVRWPGSSSKAVVAPHDDTCKRCLATRESMRAHEGAYGHVPLVGILIT